MSWITAARAASDLSLYFLILNVIPWHPAGGSVFAVIALCAFACGLAGQLQVHPAARYATALLPPLALLTASGLREMTLLAIPVVYTMLLIVTPKLFPEHDSYSRHMKISMPLTAVFLFSYEAVADSTPEMLICSVAYFLAGVFYTRQLRLGDNTTLRDKGRDLAAVAVVPAAAGGILGILLLGRALIRMLLGILFAPVGGILGLLAWSASFIPLATTEPPQASTLPPTELAEDMMATPIVMPSTTLWKQPRFEDFARTPMIIAGILAVIGIIVYLFFCFTRSESSRSGGRVISTAGQRITVSTEAKPQRREDSNRKKLRAVYVRYLMLLMSRGFNRLRRHTSRDVLEDTLTLAEPDAAKELRSIYIRARYHTELPVSAEDVRRAKELLQELTDTPQPDPK